MFRLIVKCSKDYNKHGHKNQTFPGISYPSIRAVILFIWRGHNIFMESVV